MVVCFQITVPQEVRKKDIFFCSYKKCGSSFESPELLADHMNNYHQPPFSFKPKTKSHEAIEQINTQSQQHSLTKMDHEMEPETLSEKLLRDSMKERDRISSLKTTLPIPEHNKCEQCTKSFKKPSDLIRHCRVHTKEKPYKRNYYVILSENGCSKPFNYNNFDNSLHEFDIVCINWEIGHNKIYMYICT